MYSYINTRPKEEQKGNFLKHNSFIRFAANLVDVGIQRTELKTDYGSTCSSDAFALTDLELLLFFPQGKVYIRYV